MEKTCTDKIHKLVQDVDGWLTPGEGSLLYDLAARTEGKGVVVEIGSWQGKSTIYIAHALRTLNAQPKFYAVDPHVGSEEHWQKGEKVWTFDAFEKNMQHAGVSDLVTPVVKYSTDFAKEMNELVELIFIDGAHDYHSVEEDFLAWYPKMIEGGVMAFHDTYVGGDPYKVLRKHVYPSRRFGRVCRVDSITYVRVEKRNALTIYVHNTCSMLFQDLKAFAYKVTVIRRTVSYLRYRKR